MTSCYEPRTSHSCSGWPGNRSAGELAIPLRRVTIAEEEQGARVHNGQVHRCSFTELAEVHVAAPRAQVARAERHFLGRRDGNASQHRQVWPA